MKGKYIGICSILVVLIVTLVYFNVLDNTNSNNNDNKEETKVSTENKINKSVSNKDYDLPLNTEEKSEINYIFSKLTNILNDEYKSISSKNEDEVIFTDSQEIRYLDCIAKEGYTVMNTSQNKNMNNYKDMEDYIDKVTNNKKNSDVILLNVQIDGSISYEKFIYDGENMYMINAYAYWNKDKLDVTNTQKMKVKRKRQFKCA